jgi:hypothetical protein
MSRGSIETVQSTLADALDLDSSAPRLGRMRLGLNRSLITLDRSDIVFFNVAPHRVRIQITLRNRGEEWSAPTQAVVSAAPLGAFVRWQPLATLQVPALPPRGRVTLVLDATALPSTGRRGPVGPGKLGIATDAQEPRRPRPGVGALWQALLSRFGSRVAAAGAAAPWLPADPNDMSDLERIHWAGNLNVFVGNVSVERHQAMQVRVIPGRTNFATFVVGDSPDEYAFDIAGAGDWPVELLAYDPQPEPIQLGTWVEFPDTRMLHLLLEPPLGCGAGHLDVHVRQRSTGREAVVEFGFDPHAVGPGCYKV